MARARWLVVAVIIGTCAVPIPVHAQPTADADEPPLSWNLPDAHDVQLGGLLGEAYRRSVTRLSLDPYRSVPYLRSDLSFEVERPFTNYSGDISGRFLEIASLTSPPGKLAPDVLPQLLQDIGRFQRADGHFGRDIDWNRPLEPENPRAVILPVFWGHSRLLVGLLEAYRITGREELLQAAKRIGDFYIATADRFLDVQREEEYRSTGTYAAGYVTDYFPGIEGLVRLYNISHDDRYLRQAERMAAFFERFDTLPIDHSHGNLIAQHGLLLLYEATKKPEYLERARRRWQQAWEGGYVWPIGGVGEKFHVACATDEGCSEADWLRLNLELWRPTGDTQYLHAAERLLLNHYVMNQTANGGFGHHNFVCDDTGPLFMQPTFTEAVWCCTFHGLVGLHTLKSYVVVGSRRGIFINFPIDVSAPVVTGKGTWKVTVKQDTDRPQAIACRLHTEPVDAAVGGPPPVFLRRPAWAELVTVADSRGTEFSAPCENGYLRLPPEAAAAGDIVVTFGFSPRIEDRRLRHVAIDPHQSTRFRGVILCNGPWVLLAPAEKPRPVVILSTDEEGRLTLTGDRQQGCVVPTVDNIDASRDQIDAAILNGARITLAPWQLHSGDGGTAMVFDLIVRK